MTPLSEASREQVALLHANVEHISPLVLDRWVRWANGESVFTFNDLDHMISVILRAPWQRI